MPFGKFVVDKTALRQTLFRSVRADSQIAIALAFREWSSPLSSLISSIFLSLLPVYTRTGP
jgi:hypothetical protein